ncbi:MAG: sigma-70 family RNA polymerase sigma factor [Anaeroplasmataceae bacterium]
MIFKILGFIKRLFKKNNEVNFIFSSISLPEPLNDIKELELVNKMINDKDIDARNILIEHNLRLVVFIAKKYEGDKTPLEDLISIGSMGLIKGVETFKPDKNIKLATYASRCIENEILMHFRKTKKEKCEVSLDETLNIDGDGNELILADVLGTDENMLYDDVLYEERIETMYKALNKLKPREKRIISLRFGLYNETSMTQREVALYLGISQSYISRLEKKIIDKLHLELKEKLMIN